ncbi:MAG: DUF5060 domain-containing protein [Planctomycetes bacterium]|nr:DUF5060 domain-containing protein [Planctomycetota bacterium]
MPGLPGLLIAVSFSLLAPPSSRQVIGEEDLLGLRASADRVGRFELLELRVALEREYRNPCDPAEVDLRIELTAPSGAVLILPAFFIQPYERRQLEGGRGGRGWFYPSGEAAWRARFAPMEVGRYRAVAVLEDASGAARSPAIGFECVPSGRRGFLHISAKDPRFFEHSSGEPFFAIGQNLAFIGEGQYVTLSKAEEIFAELSRSGANYLRIWTGCKDWAMGIEARKSAWGRSWSWNPPFAPLPSAAAEDASRRCVKLSGGAGARIEVSPSHPVALRPETRYVLSGRVWTEGSAAVRIEVSSSVDERVAAPGGEPGWRTFRAEFRSQAGQHWLGRTTLRLEGEGAAYIDALSLREARGGPELLWEADPDRPARGVYNQLDCFLLDEVVAAAERSGLHLQLCLLTRDLYMDSLSEVESEEYRRATEDAKKILRYAVARWGYSTSVAGWEYFNEMDPRKPTDAFYSELGAYLEEADIYRHLRSTSAWHPTARDWRHPALDIADDHFYLRPVKDRKVNDEVEAVLDRARALRESAPAKLALIGEFGLATEQWGLSGDMKRDQKLVHFHNALWASALSGLSGTALFWWWDQLDRMDHYHHYRPLADFLRDVPWTTAGLERAAVKSADPQILAIGLRGRDRAYIWIFDRRAAWASHGLRGERPPDVSGAAIEVDGLPSGRFRLEWWDTRDGRIAARSTVSIDASTPARLDAPPFTADIACRLLPE